MANFKNPIIGEDLKDIAESVDIENNAILDNNRHMEIKASLAEITRELKKLNQAISIAFNMES